MFSVRLVSADSYQAQPLPQLDPAFSEFRGSEIKHVPILRIFGITPTGEKTCLHIHGVFPYMYVPYTAEEDPTSLSYRLAASLDAAINVSLGSATSNTQHVYMIQRVSGIPYYGYHKKEHQFLKIYFYNPAMIKRAADLLQNGAVLNQSLQPHEAHIPYILQFMMDYNVYGMSMINMSGVKHRRESTSLAELVVSGQSENSENNEIEYLPSSIERQSTCQLEIDALAADILNRQEIESGLDLNPGLAAIWEEERARRLQAGLQGGDSQLVNPKSPPRPPFRPTDNDIYQEQRLARRLLMISQCDESTLSSTTNRTIAYAAEARDDEHLLNSSSISIPSIQRSHLIPQEDTIENMNLFDSPIIPESQKLSANCSVLGTEDMSLVDLLVELAGGDSVENAVSVDTDSVLGSQVSLLLNDEKSDNEEDDIDDLNLTCLQLDSLSGFDNVENPVEQRNECGNSLQEKSSLDTVHLSPFLTPNEASSSSAKFNDGEAIERETEDTGKDRIPQYDGAGDVSPTHVGSSPFSDDDDNEKDIDENTKDDDHVPEYNDRYEAPSCSRKSECSEQTDEISCRTHDDAATNNLMDCPVSCERDKIIVERSTSPYERCIIENSVDTCGVSMSDQPSNVTNDGYLSQYNIINYESFDRFLETDTDFIPDLEGMHSSMEIGILLSSGDSDSPESDRQNEDNENLIPLDTVLNGDPCFTESAELDKSDVTELRDQYASLLDNSLLPDVYTNPCTAEDLGSSSNYSDSDYQGNEKLYCSPINEQNSRSTTMSRESSSSSENVTPNIQEPEPKSSARQKINVNDNQDCKMPRLNSDNSDYNCNFVASWAELQNIREEKRLYRLRNRRKGQCITCPRQNRRKSDKKSLSNIASQFFGCLPDDMQNKVETDNFHQSPSKVPLRTNVKSPAEESTNVARLIPKCFVAECTAVTKNTATLLVLEPVEERLSFDGLPSISSVVELSCEENSEDTLSQQVRAEASLEAFHRSIIGSDNPLSESEKIFAKGLYPPDSFLEPENVVSGVSDLDELSDSNTTVIEKPDGRSIEILQGTSHYSSERSNKNYFASVAHRHCTWMLRQRQIVQDHVFTADELYIIEKRKRGKQHLPENDVCTKVDCKLPFVILKKIDCKADYRIAENVELSTSIEESSSNNSSFPSNLNSADNSIMSEESTRPHNSTVDGSVKTIESTNIPNCSPKRKPRGRRKRFISESSTTDNSSITWSSNSSDESRDFVSSDWADSEDHKRMTKKINKIRNHYNTRKRKNLSVRTKRNYFQKKCSKAVSRPPKKCYSLPGIPGIIESPKKRGRPRKTVLVDDDGNSGERRKGQSSKQKKGLRSVLFPNWSAQNEQVEAPSNGTPKLISNVRITNKRDGSSPSDKRQRTTKSGLSAAQLPKSHNKVPQDIVKDSPSIEIGDSSTATRINSNEEKRVFTTHAKQFPETEVLNSMIKEVKCSNTRAKLKLLMESRQYTIANVCKMGEERLSKTKVPNRKANSTLPRTTKLTVAGLKRLTVSTASNAKKVENPMNSEKPLVNAESAVGKKIESTSNYNGITLHAFNDIDDSEKTKNCDFAVIKPVDGSIDEFNPALNVVVVGASMDDEKISKKVVAIMDNRDESSNDPKQTSYYCDHYTINEETFFTASHNYTIDAVSLEMPTCLFEEDSNSIEQRSIKKSCYDETLSDEDSINNPKDNASLISVDPCDVDVCDVESLTSSCSSSEIGDVDRYDSFLSDSELSCSTVVESPTASELLTFPTRNYSSSEKTRDGHQASNLSKSSEFEALSPKKSKLLDNSLEQQLNVDSELEIIDNADKFNDESIIVSDRSHDLSRTEQHGKEDNTLLDEGITRFHNTGEHCDSSVSTLEVEDALTTDPARYEEVVTTIRSEAEEHMDIVDKNETMSDQGRVKDLQTTPENVQKISTVNANEKRGITDEENQSPNASEDLDPLISTTAEAMVALTGETDAAVAIDREKQQSNISTKTLIAEKLSFDSENEPPTLLNATSDIQKVEICKKDKKMLPKIDENNENVCTSILSEKIIAIEDEEESQPSVITGETALPVTGPANESSQVIPIAKTIKSKSAPMDEDIRTFTENERVAIDEIVDTNETCNVFECQITIHQSEFSEEDTTETISVSNALSTLDDSCKAEKFFRIDRNMNDASVTDVEFEQQISKSEEKSSNTFKEKPSIQIGSDHVLKNRVESYKCRPMTIKLVALDSSVFPELQLKTKRNQQKLEESANIAQCSDERGSTQIKKLLDFDKTTPSAINNPNKIVKARHLRRRSQPTRKCVEKMKLEPKVSNLTLSETRASSENNFQENKSQEDTLEQSDSSAAEILEIEPKTKNYIAVDNTIEMSRSGLEFNATTEENRQREEDNNFSEAKKITLKRAAIEESMCNESGQDVAVSSNDITSPKIAEDKFGPSKSRRSGRIVKYLAKHLKILELEAKSSDDECDEDIAGKKSPIEDNTPNPSQKTDLLAVREADNNGESKISDKPKRRGRSGKGQEEIRYTSRDEARSLQRQNLSSQDVDETVDSMTLAQAKPWRFPSLETFSPEQLSSQCHADCNIEKVSDTPKKRGRPKKDSLKTESDLFSKCLSSHEDSISVEIDSKNCMKLKTLRRSSNNRSEKIVSQSPKYRSPQEDKSINEEGDTKSSPKRKKIGRPRKNQIAATIDLSSNYVSSQEEENIDVSHAAKNRVKIKKRGRPRLKPLLETHESFLSTPELESQSDIERNDFQDSDESSQEIDIEDMEPKPSDKFKGRSRRKASIMNPRNLLEAPLSSEDNLRDISKNTLQKLERKERRRQNVATCFQKKSLKAPALQESANNPIRESKLLRSSELSQKIVDENIEPKSNDKQERKNRLRESQVINNCNINLSSRTPLSCEECRQKSVLTKSQEPMISLKTNSNEIVVAHFSKNLKDNVHKCSPPALTTEDNLPQVTKETLQSSPFSSKISETSSTEKNSPVIDGRSSENLQIKPKSLFKHKKRVCFDEESIYRCTEALRPFKLSPKNSIEQSPSKTIEKVSLKQKRCENPSNAETFLKQNNERSISSLKIEDAGTSNSSSIIAPLSPSAIYDRSDITMSEDQPVKKTNGVKQTEKSKPNSINNASLDLSSLQIHPRKLHQLYCGEDSKTREVMYQDENLLVTRLKWTTPSMTNPTEQMEHLKECDLHLVNSRSWTQNCAISCVQLKMPKVYLTRLSRDTLKMHGIQLESKNKQYVKNLKKSCGIADFQVPAYDGAADLTSSDSEDEPDVTIAREEKRVCIYQSAKKSGGSTRDSIFTPRKRKLEVEDDEVAGPSCKRSPAMKASIKSPYCSPNRTSMLKSPGRLSGYYSPLPIIVTSPKVRKETSEPLLNISDANVASSSCVTPRRKQSSLRESVMRGRISATKSSKSELGKNHDVAAIMGSERSGELDGIESSRGHEERETIFTRNPAPTILSEHTEAAKTPEVTTPRDSKDVRKKLVFPTIAENEHVDTSYDSTDETSKKKSKKLNLSHESREDFAINQDEKSIELSESLPNPNSTISHALPESLQYAKTLHSTIRDPYEVTTDEDSELDDDACNITFSQYVDSQISKNQTLVDQSQTNTETSDEKIVIRPKFNPPSRQNVMETMEMYGIPKHRNQEPFFSVESDVPKHKELAHKILKVPGKGLKDVPTFVPSIEGVTGIARWRKMKINELNPSLARSKDIDIKIALGGDEMIVVTPLAKPPTRKEVKDWLRAREYLSKKKKQEERESKKKKINEETNNDIEASAMKELDERQSNSTDLNVVVPLTEIIAENNEREKELSCTLKMRLAKKGSFNNVQEPTSSKSRRDSAEDVKIDLQRATGSDDRRGSGDSTSTEIDPSLLSVLGKSRLFREQEASKQLGISCGQIEFLSDSTRSNVANENLQNAKALTRYQYLTIMCLEVHVSTRGDLLPDAQYDAIAAIFYSVQSDVPPTSSIKPLEHGVIVLADTDKAKNKMHYSYATNIPWSTHFAKDEEALLNSLVNLITRVDPEIIIGWELETLSWGYVFQRAASLGMNLYKRISRIPATQGKWEAQPRDIETLAEVKLPGRIVLDIWRLMRHEAALLSYTFESMMHHVLNERISCPSFKTLTDWWNLEKPRPTRWRVIEHYSIRVLGIFRLLDQLDIIGRTSELARLFGIQFFEVFSRGSQYRVESVMLRLAKPLNYIAVSPSPMQRASMRAMEALPLIMEPESMFYSDPLIVLDFQSLYPSIIIAHNYCFSTCLGRIEHIGQPQPFEFGAYTLRVPKSTSLKLQGKVNFAPCGVAFVKPEVRLGVLPRMLTEILETRFMVKKAMKDHNRDDKTLQRALHSRQMGLKFLANVTYGYTAANFSGRMPCIEVGDSVISKSKETLERAIKLVETTPRWGARVVYGDTDSLFILVPGKSKADAFVIGNEIADAVTAANPPPIKLKFEKVVYPAILQTKKRYCGYMYETPEQEKPTYLAKGIETVRRDGCPAVSKILEKTLKILFETKDVSIVKKYVTRQLDKVLRGKVSIQDLTFAKEFRGLKGYKVKACVPALELTKRLMKKDPRAVPRHNERVRYVIVAGAPNQALIHCVRTPWELINDPGLRPNAIYYVTRVIIPPLNRCLNLMGVDVNDWYRAMPHRHILDNPVGQPADKQKSTIFQYFGTIVCAACGQASNKGICADCVANPVDTVVILHDKLRRLDRQISHVTAICQSCIGQADVADCASLDCPVLYRRAQAQRELTQSSHLRSIIECGNNFEL